MWGEDGADLVDGDCGKSVIAFFNDTGNDLTNSVVVLAKQSGLCSFSDLLLNVLNNFSKEEVVEFFVIDFFS